MTPRPRIFWMMGGFVLGLGAPLGSLILRIPAHLENGWASALAQEWHTGQYYYLYMTLGTTIAFALFGYILGRQNEKLGDLSITDGLTGAFNHRYLQEHLDRELERSDRYATPVTCLMLDIDDFKKVNDQYGHPFGDQVLVETNQILQDAVRRTDVVGRYGGEEFLVVMPQTGAEAASPIAERIVRSVREHVFAFRAIVSVRITVSVGLASYPFPDRGVKTKSSLLSAADQAMYQAKWAGKNQVRLWQS
jgi:diguanylate cyclase (GGDEF)-like protein